MFLEQRRERLLRIWLRTLRRRSRRSRLTWERFQQWLAGNRRSYRVPHTAERHSQERDRLRHMSYLFVIRRRLRSFMFGRRAGTLRFQP